MGPTEPRRHDRVWLDPATWRTHLRSPLDDQRLVVVDDWIGRGRALVARRREPDAAPDTCFAALASPLATGRMRIAIAVASTAVVRVEPALRLDEVVASAPIDRREALDDLVGRGARLDTTLRVYGSFAWQAIAGEPCVTLSSDLDLLWDVRDADHAAVVIATLQDWESTYGLRADGEARFADGGAVAWRELASGASRVLVKRDAGVALEHSQLGKTRSPN